ncbi:MAG: hypothetical protein EBZ48_06935, partial [Proteobacteria bacterium]|nr:hypothetical protein [Pseudomonadota bacterium]
MKRVIFFGLLGLVLTGCETHQDQESSPEVTGYSYLKNVNLTLGDGVDSEVRGILDLSIQSIQGNTAELDRAVAVENPSLGGVSVPVVLAKLPSNIAAQTTCNYKVQENGI